MSRRFDARGDRRRACRRSCGDGGCGRRRRVHRHRRGRGGRRADLSGTGGLSSPADKPEIVRATGFGRRSAKFAASNLAFGRRVWLIEPGFVIHTIGQGGPERIEARSADRRNRHRRACHPLPRLDHARRDRPRGGDDPAEVAGDLARTAHAGRRPWPAAGGSRPPGLWNLAARWWRCSISPHERAGSKPCPSWPTGRISWTRYRLVCEASARGRADPSRQRHRRRHRASMTVSWSKQPKQATPSPVMRSLSGTG